MKAVEIGMVVFVLLYSSVLHEIMHAWTALKFGDPTAFALGRITLNPLKHLDPFYSILLPALTYFSTGVAFGGAKPVPINVLKLRYPSRDFAISCAAGPLTNLAILLVAVLLTGLLGRADLSLLVNPDVQRVTLPGLFFWIVILVNTTLFLFNMLPIPPLDGSRVVRHFLPEAGRRAMDRIESFGMFLVFAAVYVLGQPRGPLSRLFWEARLLVLKALAHLMGPDAAAEYFSALGRNS